MTAAHLSKNDANEVKAIEQLMFEVIKKTTANSGRRILR